jgi:hypothetical protein
MITPLVKQFMPDRRQNEKRAEGNEMRGHVMSNSELYSEEQIRHIRSTLQSTMGEVLGGTLDNLESRFQTRTITNEADEPENKKQPPSPEEKSDKKLHLDIDEVIEKNRLLSLLSSLDDAKENLTQSSRLVTALLAHPEAKPFHLVNALGKTFRHKKLLCQIVDDLCTRKGITPLIDALGLAESCPEEVTKLATAIAQNGSVNHLIRSIATAPKNQPKAEIILTMEVMARGSTQQILEAINLLDAHSPGAIILATGLVNRSEIAIEPLVRALNSVKINHVASAVLAIKISEMSDTTTLVTLLEKYVSDDSSAGEILTTKLVHQSLKEKGRTKYMAKASSYMHKNSISGKILAMGILKQGSVIQMERAYKRMKPHPIGQKMMAVGISKKLGTIKAMKILGSQLFKISTFEKEVKAAFQEAQEYYELVLVDLGINAAQEETPKEKLARSLAK